MPSEPTEQDHRNATRRASIAARFRKEFDDTFALSEIALGPGWEPIATHSLVEHQEADAARRENRRMTPAAVVYTAAKDGLKRHFMVRDGRSVEVASVEEGFGQMLTEPDPDRTIEVKGQRVALHRYGLYWSGFEKDYRPQTAEQLATARSKREARSVEKEADGSLFADLIRQEGYVPRQGKPR